MSSERLITDEAFFRAVVRDASSAILAVDGGGRIVFANRSVETVLGVDPDAIVGETYRTLLPPGESSFAETVHSLDSGTASETTHTGIRHQVEDGTGTVADVTIREIDHGDDRLFALYLDDAADRERRRRELRTARERFEKVFRHANDGIIVFDPEADEIVEANPRASEMLGYSQDELRSMKPSEIHPHDIDLFRGFVDEVFEEGSGWTDELRCRTKDGGLLDVEVSASVLELDREPHVVANIRDVSDRLEREREVARRSLAMESAVDGMAILDEDGEFRYVNRAYVEMHGYDTARELVGESWREVYGEEVIRRFELDVFPTARSEERWRGEVTGRRTDGETFPQELTVSRLPDEGFVWVVRDITERKERERQLQTLAETGRDLMAEETQEAIARRTIEAVGSVFGFEVCCVRLYDAETNSLESVAASEKAEQLRSSRPAFDLEATYAGRAFREGATVRNEANEDDPYDPGEAVSSLHFPLDEYGVLTVIDQSAADFESHEVGLGELLATTVTGALARAERERQLRESERELREQRDRLATLDRTNMLVRRLLRSLVEARTREAIERTVCEGLADSEFYRAAWVSDPREDDDVYRTAAEVSDASIRPSTVAETTRGGERVVESALRTGEIATIRQHRVTDPGSDPESIPDEHPPDDWVSETVAVVPLTYADRDYGVLVVHSDREEAVERASEGLAVLGETVAFALGAVRSRRLLLSDETVELELEFGSTEGFAAIAADLDCTCLHTRDVPTRDGEVLHYVRVTGAPTGEVVDRVDRADRFERVQVVTDHGDECLLEVTVEESFPETLADLGAQLQSMVADGSETRAVVEVPEGTDVRSFLETLRSRYPGVELVAKREVDGVERSPADLLESLEERLTDRQQAAIEAAYAAGYFEMPRETTAEEVADSLGITSSTFHGHLRKAERKLLSAFLDDPAFDETHRE